MSLWREYVAEHPEHREEQPPVESFGDSPAMADELLALVIDGPKRATAGLVAAYEADNDILPSAGSHWIVKDGSGVERVVLRTTDVRLGPVDSVDDSFAYDEGEGERTRESWLHDHRHFFERQVAQRGIPTPDGLDAMICIFERFVIVWPPEHAD